MRFIKRIYRSMLLFLAIALSVPLSANAAIPNVSPPIVPSKEWSYVNILDTKSQTFLCYTSS